MNKGNQIVIIDYGMGNLNSIKKKLVSLNADVIISSEKVVIQNADKIILPGVGHFGKAMQRLQELQLVDMLTEEVVKKGKPVLGICLGMQLMAKRSDEGNVNGLGWFDAEVIKIKVTDTLKYKVPHTGWNQIEILKSSRLMANIPNSSEFYFVHSFHFKPNNISDVLNETQYDNKIVSAVERENIYGVQYHPEKSHDAGKILLNNFINL